MAKSETVFTDLKTESRPNVRPNCKEEKEDGEVFEGFSDDDIEECTRRSASTKNYYKELITKVANDEVDIEIDNLGPTTTLAKSPKEESATADTSTMNLPGKATKMKGKKLRSLRNTKGEKLKSSEVSESKQSQVTYKQVGARQSSHPRSTARCYTCGVCGVKLKRIDILSRHVRNMHNKDAPKLTCAFTECPFTTVYAYSMERHMKVHDQSTINEVVTRPAAVLTCRLCEFSTRSPHIMERHAEIHSSSQSEK